MEEEASREVKGGEALLREVLGRGGGAGERRWQRYLHLETLSIPTRNSCDLHLTQRFPGEEDGERRSRRREEREDKRGFSSSSSFFIAASSPSGSD